MYGELIFSKTRSNVSTFKTISRKEAKRFKELLDSEKAAYSTNIVSNGKGIWDITFTIYTSRFNGDILKLMFSMMKEEENDN